MQLLIFIFFFSEGGKGISFCSKPLPVLEILKEAAED